MRDTIDTALSFGMVTDSVHLEFTPFTLDSLYQPDHPEAQNFLDFLNDWTRLTTMLNEMSRSMGQPDFYPFVLPREVVARLHFIHLLVTSSSWLPHDAGMVAEAPQEAAPQLVGRPEVQMHTNDQVDGQTQTQASYSSNGFEQNQMQGYTEPLTEQTDPKNQHF